MASSAWTASAASTTSTASGRSATSTARLLKQGGLAAQQADVAAADIAAQIGGVDVDVQPYRPKLQGVLLTGADPLYLQHDPRAAVSSDASREPLWWPPQKVAGTHLGPYLETLDGAAVA